MPDAPCHEPQALVIRSQAVSLGPDHVDTQLVSHNLGCVLEQLGRRQKALELINHAYQVVLLSIPGSTNTFTIQFIPDTFVFTIHLNQSMVLKDISYIYIYALLNKY